LNERPIFDYGIEAYYAFLEFSAFIHLWVLAKDDTTDWLLWSQNISGEKSSHRSVSRLRASL
jgi:hypothetical protein